jgi:hypothetical protein
MSDTKLSKKTCEYERSLKYVYVNNHKFGVSKIAKHDQKIP